MIAVYNDYTTLARKVNALVAVQRRIIDTGIDRPVPCHIRVSQSGDTYILQWEVKDSRSAKR